jgi:glycosyltransferase involved in cell wall biosynthesis
MSDIAIRVENLSKQYRIGGPQARYKTIRESLIEAVRAPFRRAARLLSGQAYGAAEMTETIWALKDGSFEVKHGEVLRHGENAWLVEPGNPKALAEGIKRVLDDSDLARRISERAYSEVWQYSWEQRARKVINSLRI